MLIFAYLDLFLDFMVGVVENEFIPEIVEFSFFKNKNILQFVLAILYHLVIYGDDNHQNAVYESVPSLQFENFYDKNTHIQLSFSQFVHDLIATNNDFTSTFFELGVLKNIFVFLDCLSFLIKKCFVTVHF
jgi:hypothetical protein